MPAGRPRKEIDIKVAIGMVEILCTQDEVCGTLGVSEDTLDLRLKEHGYDNFKDFFKKHSANGKKSLRRAQVDAALGGNSTMLVWLGKQHLGQKDKNEVTGLEDGPIQLVIKREIVDDVAGD